MVIRTNESSKNNDDNSRFPNDNSTNTIRNEDAQNCLDDTEIIEIGDLNSLEEGTPQSSSKLPSEFDANSSTVKPNSSHSEHENSSDKHENPKKSISPGPILNPPHSLPTSIARKGVVQGKSPENFLGHDDTAPPVLRNQCSGSEKSTPTAGGSKALHPLKGSYRLKM